MFSVSDLCIYNFLKYTNCCYDEICKASTLGCLFLRLWTTSPSFPFQPSHTASLVLGTSPEHAALGSWETNLTPSAAVTCQKKDSLLATTELKSQHWVLLHLFMLLPRSLPGLPARLALAQHSARAVPTLLASQAHQVNHRHAFLPEPPFSCLLCHCEASKFFSELLCILALLYKKHMKSWKCLSKTLPFGSCSISLLSFTTQFSISSLPALPHQFTCLIYNHTAFVLQGSDTLQIFFLTSQQRTIFIQLSSNSLNKMNHNISNQMNLD